MYQHFIDPDLRKDLLLLVGFRWFQLYQEFEKSIQQAGADPGLFLGGGAPLRNGVTNTNKPHIFLQNTSCIRNP